MLHDLVTCIALFGQGIFDFVLFCKFPVLFFEILAGSSRRLSSQSPDSPQLLAAVECVAEDSLNSNRLTPAEPQFSFLSHFG